MTTHQLLVSTAESIVQLREESINQMAQLLDGIRGNGGRLFLIGCGGGAAHASHAAADFRKLCNIDAHCVTDNVAELTARINDDGWLNAYRDCIEGITARDAVMAISVGGGDKERDISANLVMACEHALKQGALVFAIVGRDGGAIGRIASVCVLIPCHDPEHVTFVTEGVQSVVLHALAAHPILALKKAKWEGVQP